jgi:hypothetical protein
VSESDALPVRPFARFAAGPALLAFSGWRLLAAAAVGAPIALELGAAGAAASTAGDLDAFAPGALLLSDVVRRALPELSAALKAGLVVALVLALLGLLPLGALLSALTEPARTPLRQHFSRAACVFPVFLGLSATLLLAQGAWLLAISICASMLGAAVAHRGSLSILAPLGLYAVGLLGTLELGVLLDLARAAAVKHELRTRAALIYALSTLRRSAGAASAAYFACAGASVFAIALAARLTQGLDVGRPGGWRVAAVFGVHQVALLTLVFARYVWLKRAVALSATSADGLGGPTPTNYSASSQQ